MDEPAPVAVEVLRYSAFISYSHGDGVVARWLHEALETYPVPASFRNHPLVSPRKGRLRSIFRDREELPSGPSLSHAIVGALTDSQFLIVVCSPRAAQSKYVNWEVDHFRSLGRSDRILAVIVGGEPNASSRGEPELECFPKALRAASREDHATSEPLAADARPGGDGKRIAVLKLQAAMLGTSLGELRQRDDLRRRRLVRQRLALGSGAFAVTAGFFLLASDAGLGTPGGETVRTVIDRYDLSVLRTVPRDAETLARAAALRRHYITVLDGCRLPDGRFPWDTTSIPEHADIWCTSQVLAALCRAPESPSAMKDRILASFRHLFDPEMLATPSGAALGWRHRRNAANTCGPVALWMTTALAAAIAREDLFNELERGELRRLLARSQVICEQYRSQERPGGWKLMGSMLYDGPNSYSAALALQALLQMQRAKLPWGEDEGLRTRLLRQTAGWLVASYEPTLTGSGTGWQKYPGEGDGAGYDGLALQIFALLLEAEAIGATELPDVLVENMLRNVELCANRSESYPSSTAEFEFSIVVGGEVRDLSEGIGFRWLPWALAASQGLLDRHRRVPLGPEDLTRVRRARAHLVNLAGGDDAMNEKALFAMAELVYALGRVR